MGEVADDFPPAGSSSSPTREIPRCSIVTCKRPPRGTVMRTAAGAARLTDMQRSGRTDCGGAGAEQPVSPAAEKTAMHDNTAAVVRRRRLLSAPNPCAKLADPRIRLAPPTRDRGAARFLLRLRSRAAKSQGSRCPGLAASFAATVCWHARQLRDSLMATQNIESV